MKHKRKCCDFVTLTCFVLCIVVLGEKIVCQINMDVSNTNSDGLLSGWCWLDQIPRLIHLHSLLITMQKPCSSNPHSARIHNVEQRGTSLCVLCFHCCNSAIAATLITFRDLLISVCLSISLSLYISVCISSSLSLFISPSPSLYLSISLCLLSLHIDR